MLIAFAKERKMAHSFNCPNCGAPLDYDGNDPIIRCPYCKSSVIVPENLRPRPSFSSKPSDFTFSGIGNLGGLVKQASRINEVKQLAEAGRFDEAVSIFREITGSDESSARQAVGRLSAGQPVTLAMSQDFSGSPIPVQNTAKLGRWIGCGVTLLVLGILTSVLIPVGLALFGAFSTNGFSGGTVPLLGGFASRELSFGGEGTGPGKFGDVRAISVDSVSGKIYAANYDDGRVQVFDSQGNFLTQWVIPELDGLEPYFDNMVVGRDGTVLIPVFGKIYQYDDQGNLLQQIEHYDYRFEDIDVALDGSFVTIANGEDIVWLTAEGEIRQEVKAAVSTISDDSELSSSVAVDGLGNVYVLGHFNTAVFIFGPDGKFINRFGSDGDAGGQFRAPQAIKVDPLGRIFVSDIKGVQVFSNDGRYLNVINVEHFAYGLSIDDQGLLFVTTNQKKVEKFRVNE